MDKTSYEKLEKGPKYFNELSEADKIEYIALQEYLSNSQKRSLRNKKKDDLQRQ